MRLLWIIAAYDGELPREQAMSDDMEPLPTDDELEEMRIAYDAYLTRIGRPETSGCINFYHGYFAAMRKVKNESRAYTRPTNEQR